jgi:hypothetical protein
MIEGQRPLLPGCWDRRINGEVSVRFRTYGSEPFQPFDFSIFQFELRFPQIELGFAFENRECSPRWYRLADIQGRHSRIEQASAA